MSSRPQVVLVPATVPLLHALTEDRTVFGEPTGVLVALGFEHVADHEDPQVGTVSQWRWTRPLATRR